MRSFTLAVAGLAALSHAFPTGSDAIALEKKQFKIGDPSTVFTPGSNPVPAKPEWHYPTTPDDPTFQIGRRDTEISERSLAGVDDLYAAFLALAKPYSESHRPSFGTYMVLQQMAAILAGQGRNPNIIIFGPAETHFQISSRQVFSIGGCSTDDLVGLLLTYSSLRSIYGPNPPSQIKALKEAIYAALKYCNMDPETGAITPDKPVPGAPIVPDKPVPGAPIVPNVPVPGAPMKPST
jgi:hypothetical protein